MPSINDRARAAGDPNASVNVLVAASIDRAPKVRSAAAENPSTPPEVLAQLVEDGTAARSGDRLGHAA
ncbi:hypothetical protein [Janibacter terrae]|uniref:hypothetical protein n=1 Tax=Janibacter terrae TaxID=103817 RepID=UPI003BB13779